MGFELDWTASARQLLNDKFAGKFVGGLPFGKDACEAGLGDIPDSGIAVVSGFDVNDCHRFISLGHTSYGYLAQARTNSLATQVISDGTEQDDPSAIPPSGGRDVDRMRASRKRAGQLCLCPGDVFM
jgi:hypothetical protein